MPASLIINHSIFLTKEERYALHEGKDIITSGISVPVWIVNGITSEPAKEVICKYTLKTPDEKTDTIIQKDGYEISIPFRKGTKPKKISNEEWRNLTNKQMTNYYSMIVPEVSTKNLLDVEDGGSKYMSYRERSKIEKNNDTLHIIHYVIIKDMVDLEESFLMI